METKLQRIAELAKVQPDIKFTALVHLLNVESLKDCHYELPGGKATGINQVTKEKYGENLDENIAKLVEAMKKKSYKPTPVRRTYIDKAGSKMKRPLGIPEHEDKIVQRGIAKILNAIYEPVFLDCSFGFRPNRNCHDALKILNVYIEKRNTNFIVDVDIKGFFDNVSHEWLMKFLQHKIADPNLLRIIARFLKGGYMEEGKYYKTDVGTPQGGIVSPILANIYLHYVLDLWFEKVIRKSCRGQAYMVRYADDFVCCFQSETEANNFYRDLIVRLKEFNLEISEEKTKIIPFGKFTEENNKRQGKGKPETFEFLGFTHYCSQSKHGKFRVKRKTSGKKMRGKLKACKQWLKINRTTDIHVVIKRLQRSLNGYFNYYCITDNSHSVRNFVEKVKMLFFKWMNRRSQRKSFNFEKFTAFLRKFPFPVPRVKVSIFELRADISYIL